MTTVTVNPELVIGRINPNLFGHFAEHLGTCIYEGLWVGDDSSIANTAGFRNDVVEALQRIRPPLIRWPGGCFADTYHWRDGIGPAESRPLRVNTFWGQAPEPNAVGTHEFVRLCRLLGAQPYFCGNVGSGTPGEMADWIEYCNFNRDSTLARERAANGSPEPLGVTYWGVGNENWGCGGDLDPEDYAVEYRRFSTFLHEFGGHPLFLVACGPSSNDVDWTHRFMQKRRNRGRLHGYAAHYYCGTDGSATTYSDDQFLTLVKRALVGMERLVLQQRAALDSYDPDRRIGLIVDEWGTWHAPSAGRPQLWQQNTMRDALVAAGTLNIFCRHADKVVMSNIAQMVNVLQAMVLTDGSRMLCTPTYHVYEMHVPHQDARAVRLDVATDAVSFTEGGKPAELAAVAGAASKKAQTLFVTLTAHRTDQPEEVVLHVGSKPAKATARVLAGESIQAHNTFDQPDLVRPVTLPVTPDGDGLRLTLPPASVASVTMEW